MDHRRLDHNFNWRSYDERRMLILIDVQEADLRYENFEDETRETIELPAKYEICHTCEGRGRVVDPSIDEHGLTYNDFAEDPGFEKEYFSGVYDITCNECGGTGKVLEVDEDRCDPEYLKKYREMLEEEYNYQYTLAKEREMGY